LDNGLSPAFPVRITLKVGSFLTKKMVNYLRKGF